MEKVYVVNMQYYGEWFWECGANDILGVYSNLEGALKMFQKAIVNELFEEEDRIIESTNDRIKVDSNIQDIKRLVESARKSFENGNDNYYVNEYINEDYYNDRNDSAIIEIKEIELNKGII